MNRIAGRAWIAIALVLALLVGMFVFLGEFAAEGASWVTFSGSPHLYSGGRAAVKVTDGSGTLLTDISGGQIYAQDADLRRAVLHWTGDREGNIATPVYDHYVDALSGYRALTGLYSFTTGGSTLELTIDANVQKAALAALDGLHGTVAVYNYKTGELLCAVSSPTFDPDDVPDIAGDETGEYEGVYLNRFLQTAYIPGSIFKLVTMAAALELIPDIGQRTFFCEAAYEMDGDYVTCEAWHGEQTLQDALANSCNCAFAQIVELIGAQKLEQFVKQFRVTEPISFDGMTSASGNFTCTDTAALNTAWAGIGQYLDEINPCAYLTFVGTLAAGGAGVEPHIVRSVTVGGRTTYEAEAVKTPRILSKTTAQTLADAMRNNVETVYGADNFAGLAVCAKSGTAQTGDGEPNAMFVGFSVDEKYPLAFFIAAEKGGYGGTACVPIAGEVLAACKAAIDAR